MPGAIAPCGQILGQYAHVKTSQHNILIIEKSATFSQLLRQTLQAGGLKSLRAIPRFPSLPKSRKAFDKVNAVVIGTNANDMAAVARFLHQLAESHGHIPVTIVTDNPKQLQKLQLPPARLLNWSEFSRLPGVLNQAWQESADSRPEPLTEPIRILFVDDSYSVRFAYQKMLLENGYAVDVAKNALDALKLAKKNAYDLAIVDYYLPDTNGDKLCSLLKQLDKSGHLQIALLTATYRDDVIKSALESGAIECMFKNEAKELFLARIASLARHVKAQKGLLESKKELLHVLQSVHDLILGVNSDNKIAFFNKHAKKVTGENTRLLGLPLSKALTFYDKQPGSGHLLPLNGTGLDKLLDRDNLVCSLSADPDSLFDCNITRIDKNNEQVEFLIILR